jgi:Domain of unknown function (DUF4421)
MNSKLQIILVTFLFTFTAYAQESTEILIQDYSSDFILKLYSKITTHDFAIEDNNTDTRIEYKPNFQVNTGVGFNYKWLGLGIAFKAPFINNDNDKYGETTQFDVQLNIYSRRLILDLNFLYYQGFYINNAEDLYNIKPIEVYPSRRDINSASIGGSFYFIANENFSYKSAFISNEFQEESAGSLIMGSYFSIYGMQADSIIVPFEFRDSIDEQLHVKAANSINMGGSIGYAHTFVTMDDFYFTFGIVPGIGIQGYSKQLENGELVDNEKLGVSLKVQLRAAFGYNRTKHFANLAFVKDSYAITDSEYLNLNYGYGNIKLTFGYRF